MVISDISMFIESMEYIQNLFFYKKLTNNIEEKKNTKSLEKSVDWMDKKNELLIKKEKQIENMRAEMQILRNLVKQKDDRIEQLTIMLHELERRKLSSSF
jgi:predicted RNase H-like nuclease (RuvC/YqgF family)